MFENFSFDTPRSPSVDSNNTTTTIESRSVSPCSPMSPYPVAQYSVTDLAADFHRQRLRQDSQIYTQSCDSYAALDDDAGWSIEPETHIAMASRVRASSVRSLSPTRRRIERQANARMLCSTSHHRDIAALVAKMINEQEQCLVGPPTTITQSMLQPDEEEDDSADLAPLSRTSSTLSISRSREYRRPSDLRKPSSSICKEVRLRKEKPRRQKTADK